MSNKTFLSEKNSVLSMATFLDPDFFINIESDYVPSAEYKKIIGHDELIKKSVYFNVVNPEAKTPNQGWKIHVSAIPSNAKVILEICSNVCNEYKVSFKFMCDPKILVMSCGKNWPRNESGKFITIYPTSTDQFKTLIYILYKRLRDYTGPYILSDKRYQNDCSVLFYRYGGFKAMAMPNGELYILDDKGKKHIDKRNVTYHKPSWVTDPFEEQWLKPSSKKQPTFTLLSVNYQITGIIRHTNSGGIYLGKNLITGDNLVIKEARPHTSINLKNDDDAIIIKKREWEILNILSQDGITSIPRPIQLLPKWENTFLIESEIKGEDLQHFMARTNPLTFSNLYGNSDNRTVQYRDYLTKIKTIFLNLLAEFKKIHDANIYIGDISAFNIIVDSQLNVFFPDLEGAGFITRPNTIDNFTPGFKSKVMKFSPVDSDYFGLGSIIVTLLLPINYEYEINPSVIERFLLSLNVDFNLPEKFIGLIKKLIYVEDKICIEDIINQLQNIDFSNVVISKEAKASNIPINLVSNELKQINAYLYSHINYEHVRNIIPGDLIRSNSLSISNGIAGLMHYAISNVLPVEDKMHESILKNSESISEYGLYTGLAGLAWTLMESSDTDNVSIIMKKVNDHIDHTQIGFGIKKGIAGIGLTNLYCFNKTGDKYYLEQAIAIKKELLENAQMNICHIYWKGDQDRIICGYANGAVGISLFLLLLSHITNDKFLLSIAKKALNFEMSNVVDNDVTVGLRRYTDSNIVSPYLFSGTAGLVAVLLRFYRITEIDKYRKYAERLLTDLDRKYLINTGYGEGLAGLGMVLLDAYQILGDKKYLSDAWRVYDGLQLFKIQKDTGIAYPGTLLLRISNDFETGTIGVAQFYQRLIDKKKTHDFFLDELI